MIYAQHTVVSPVSILTNQPYDDGLIQLLLSIHLDRNIIYTLLGSLFVGKLDLQTYPRSSNTIKCMQIRWAVKIFD